MYEEIVDSLERAKKVKQPAGTRLALLSLVTQLEQSARGTITHQTLAPFIEDSRFILSADTQIYYDDKADVRLITTGLVDQLMEALGAADHFQLAEDLKAAIFDLHSLVSRGVSDHESKRSALLSNLSTIRATIDATTN